MEYIWIPILAIAGSYALVGFIVWANVSSRRRRAELKAEVQTKLIEKFNSAPELLQFLESEKGRELVDTIERQPIITANERILSGIRKGIILTFLGLAFLSIRVFDGNRGVIWPGFILTGLGIAFFVSTFVSMKLSKSWGLTPTDSGRGLD